MSRKNIRSIRIKSVVLTTLTLTLGAVVGVGTGSVISAASTPQVFTPNQSSYPTNANGQTYGSALGATTPPDLVQAFATNGHVGYVSESQLLSASGGDETTPAEAIAWDSEANQSTNIPVYESNGTTVIGSFSISGNALATSAAPMSK
jgi:hypothetical protein